MLYNNCQFIKDMDYSMRRWVVKKHGTLLGTLIISMVFVNAVAVGSEGLSKGEAEKLIKGNTVEGMNTKWNKKMIWYFHESGQLRKQDEHGNKGKANWRIDDKGRLCYSDKHKSEEDCEAIIPDADGGYDVLDGKWKWNKVVPGNSHNL
jgi:hypothetical protein